MSKYLSAITAASRLFGAAYGLQHHKRDSTSIYTNSSISLSESTSTLLPSNSSFSPTISSSPGFLSASSSASSTTTPASFTHSTAINCCAVYANFVALNFWYNATYEYVEKTIITEYIQYNNTVVPTTTTVDSNSSVSLGVYPALDYTQGLFFLTGIPTDLVAVSDYGYEGSALNQGSVYVDNFTTIASPTPFLAVYTSMWVFWGTSGSDGTCYGGNTVTSVESALTNAPQTTTQVYQFDIEKVASSLFVHNLPESGPFYTMLDLPPIYVAQDLAEVANWTGQGVMGVDIAPEMVAYLARDPAALSQFPYFSLCSGGSGLGAPTVHIPVSALTVSTKTTIKVNDVFTATSTVASASPSPSPQASSTQPAPTSTTQSIQTTTKSAQTAPVLDQPSSSSADAQTPIRPQTPSESGSSPQAGVGTEPEKTYSSTEPAALPVSSSPNPQSPQASNADAQPQFTAPSSSNAASATVVGPGSAATSPQSSNEVGAVVGGGESVSAAGDQTAFTVSPETVVINGQTSPVATTAQAPAATVVTFGTAEATLGSSGAFVVSGQTVSEGGPAVTAAGQTISLASSGTVIVNGQSSAINVESPQPTAVADVPSATLVTFGTAEATHISSGVFVVSGQTVSEGGPAVTAADQTISLASSGTIVVNGQSSAINMESPQPTLAVIGEVTITKAASGSAYVVAGQTISAGGPAVTVSGTTYSLPEGGSNSVVVNGATASIGDISPQASTPVQSSEYIFGSQTLSPGSTLIVQGTTYSLAPSGNGIVVNGHTSEIAQAIGASVLTLGSQVLTYSAAAATPFVVGSQTLQPGGPAVTVHGQTLSLPAGGDSAIVVNGQTTSFATADGDSVLTAGSQVLSFASEGSALVFGSQTLVPGGSGITVSGETLSLPSDAGGSIVVNGRTTGLPTAAASLLAVGSQTLSFTTQGSALVFGSQTLVPGGPQITANGETLSLPLTATGSIVVNGHTTALPTAAASVLTIGSQTLSFTSSGSAIIIASQTLYPGSNPVTISGETLSLPTATGANAIIVNGKTTSLPFANSALTLVIGAQTLSFTPASSGVVIASQTLYPGGTAVVVNGETLSLAATDGSIVVVSGGKTTTEGLGGFIISGLGGPSRGAVTAVETTTSSGGSTASTAAPTTRATTGSVASPGAGGADGTSTSSKGAAARLVGVGACWVGLGSSVVSLVLGLLVL